MDSEEENEAPTWRGVPGTLIMINCFDNKSTTGTSSIAHTASCLLVKQCLRSVSSGLVGICLYGVENSSSSAFAIENVVDVFPLMVPSLDEYKKLQNEKIMAYKPAAELKLSDVLWHSSKMFANCKKQLSTRTVIMLTRLDIPPLESDRDPALERVSDLVDSNIDLKIINISQSDYTPHPFYEHLLIQADKDNKITLPKPMWDPKEIEKLLQSQSHRHLAVAQLSLEIGNNISIGVGVYNLLKSGNSYYKKVELEKENNVVVTSVTKNMKISNEIATTMDDGSSEPKQVPLMKSELLHYVEYGGKRIEFTDMEKKNMKNPFGPPGMKLLGFKPSHIICKEKWFLKKSSFLFPNEKLVEGSTIAFKALHRACLEMNVVAICILCTRVNARYQIAALSPCSRPVGLDVEVGFDVIHIPYIENVRELPASEYTDIKILEAQKVVMKEILKTVQFEYKPDMFENPDLQSKYRAIEAIALEEDEVEPFIDTTKPSSSKFETIQGDLFEEIFGPFCAGAPKRNASSKEVGVGNKKAKLSVNDEDKLKEHIRNCTVHKYTVADLKELLKKHKVTLTGLKKDQLVELVYEYYKE